MPAGRTKKFVYALIAAAIIAAAGYALRPLPVSVDTAIIGKGSLTVTIDEEGKTRVREVYEISAPVAGKMQRSPLEVGDEVVANETVVAIIESTSPAFLDVRSRRESEAAASAAAAAVALARAEVQRATSELKFARMELNRSRTLSETNVVSAKAYEQATLDVEKKTALLAIAEATLQLKIHEHESAQAHLIGPESGNRAPRAEDCCIKVRSPVKGRVLRIVAESEQVVKPGALLVEIGDPDDLEIIVELLSSAAVQIAPGADASVEGWGGSQAISATVTKVEPTGFTKVSALGVEEQRVNVLLDLTGPPEVREKLGHAFRVFTRIRRWHDEDVLRVPLGALFRAKNEWAVYRVVDGRAVLTKVTIDHRNTEHARVTGGLNLGDEVILYPSDRIEDGSRIELRQ